MKRFFVCLINCGWHKCKYWYSDHLFTENLNYSTSQYQKQQVFFGIPISCECVCYTDDPKQDQQGGEEDPLCGLVENRTNLKTVAERRKKNDIRATSIGSSQTLYDKLWHQGGSFSQRIILLRSRTFEPINSSAGRNEPLHPPLTTNSINRHFQRLNGCCYLLLCLSLSMYHVRVCVSLEALIKWTLSTVAAK